MPTAENKAQDYLSAPLMAENPETRKGQKVLQQFPKRCTETRIDARKNFAQNCGSVDRESVESQKILQFRLHAGGMCA